MRFKISLIALLILGIAFSTVAFARSSGNEVTIVNRTGRDIRAIYISPVTRGDWDRCSGTLYSGDATEIYVPSRRDVKFWDIRCTYTNGSSDVWYGVDLYGSGMVVLKRGGNFDDDDDYYSGGGYDDDHDDDYYDRRY